MHHVGGPGYLRNKENKTTGATLIGMTPVAFYIKTWLVSRV